MLDKSALGQLKDLKKQIHESIPRDKGIVKGTSKRFGFVIADKDGQQYLLPQTEMERVLPGDHIQFVLEKGNSDSDKPIAKIEKFFSTELTEFIGVIKSKKDQMYVIPDHPQFNRWVFIPPKYRKGLKEGDLVAAKISQHPYKTNGRVQAEIQALIGQPDDPFIEHRYAIVKQGITEKIWQQDELDAIRQTAEQKLDETIPSRKDMRDQMFFTIDGASTQDLDDALSIRATDNGWILDVAIADVATFIDAGSPLDKLAARQASSIYLPGQKISMLPDVLASDICALKPGLDRLALVCELTITSGGEISNTTYYEAAINSKAKLNYDEVANYLDNDASSYPDEIKSHLQLLKELANTRIKWRTENALLMDLYTDYRLLLNDKGKITSIEKMERNSAQRLVEECMLACNEATADFLSNKADSALYLAHNGFKKDQMPGVEKLLDAHFPDFDKTTANTLSGYKDLFRLIDTSDSDLALKEILRKKLVRSEWTTNSTPHFGLAINAYTTFTSPIRKYSDLLVHRIIKAIINDDSLKKLEEDVVTNLNNALQSVRNAQRDCELSLKCQYLNEHKGKVYEGEISMINHRAIGIYLPDFDIHAQIDVRSLNTPFTFKQDSLQLLSDTLNFKLKQKVTVEIDHVDLPQRLVKLKLITEQDASAA